MKFFVLSTYLQKLEQTPSRNQMTVILAKLLKEASLADIDKVCYLVLGRMGPAFEGIEFGISDKLMMRALKQAFDKPIEEVAKSYKQQGDLGEVAADFKIAVPPSGLYVKDVFTRLSHIAADSGQGSQERKIKALAELIQQVDSLSAKYIVRILLGKLRLGFSDLTLLDALSWMLGGDKSARKEIESAYVVSADIGKIARVTKKEGLIGLREIQIEVGVPIRPALPERLGSAREIIEKLGKCGVEPKLDGFRVQIHVKKILAAEANVLEAKPENQSELFTEFGIKNNVFVRVFSRNLEDTTAMFPDLVKAAQQLPVKSAVLDGEAIAFNPKTKKFLPFQETVQRKRKYGISQKVKDVPLKVFAFDLLYVDGQPLLKRLFKERRQKLVKILKNQTMIMANEQHLVNSTEKLRALFDYYIAEDLEGVVCKRINSIYQAGARNFNWVKLKRATEGTGLADTIDAVVMGYYAGQGQRTRFGLGAFLVGVLNRKTGEILTLAKIGTGLTDDQWREMKKRVDQIEVSEKPKEFVVSKELTPDTWTRPLLIVEIKADEITRSPVHTTAWKGKTGLALRFPRLVSIRDDKGVDDATTVKEVLCLYTIQQK